MSLSALANSLRQAFNRANIGSLPSMLKLIAFGDVLRTLPTQLRAKDPVAAAGNNPYVVQSGADVLTLPESAKGAVLDLVYARKGTGTSGALTVDPQAASAPAAGHCKLSPTGDILFAAADAWTSVDALYRPQKQDVIEVVLPVASNVVVFPVAIKNVVSILEAESLVGTLVAKLVVQQPEAQGSVSTGQAALSLDKTQANFATADAVTSVRLKLGVASAVDVDALLEAASSQI